MRSRCLMHWPIRGKRKFNPVTNRDAVALLTLSLLMNSRLIGFTLKVTSENQECPKKSKSGHSPQPLFLRLFPYHCECANFRGSLGSCNADTCIIHQQRGAEYENRTRIMYRIFIYHEKRRKYYWTKFLWRPLKIQVPTALSVHSEIWNAFGVIKLPDDVNITGICCVLLDALHLWRRVGSRLVLSLLYWWSEQISSCFH